MVKSLIFSHIIYDPYTYLFSTKGGLLRPKELARVRNKDE